MAEQMNPSGIDALASAWARIAEEAECTALRAAGGPDARSRHHEKSIPTMHERIDRAQGKPC